MISHKMNCIYGRYTISEWFLGEISDKNEIAFPAHASVYEEGKESQTLTPESYRCQPFSIWSTQIVCVRCKAFINPIKDTHVFDMG